LYEDLGWPDEKETERIQTVAQQLIDARLVSSGQDKEGQTYYEPAHDALIKAWPRLWEWIRGMGERKLQLMYKLNMAVIDYQENKEKEYLWNDDPRLNYLAPDLHHEKHIFNTQETNFLERSLALKMRNHRRKLISTIGVIVTLVSISLISIIFYLKAERALIKAERSLIETKILQEKEVNAKYKANLALLRLDTLGKDIVAAKAETTEIVFKSIDALQLYAEKNKNPGRFKKANQLAKLTQEIKDYGARLKVLIPAPYEGSGWGYNDASGNVAIYPKYEEAQAFGDNGLATVKLKGVYYQIDKNGKIQGVADPLWQWQTMQNGGRLPANAVQAGFELEGKDTIPLYVGQNSYWLDQQEGMHAGKLRSGRLSLPWEGKVIHRDTCAVLVLSPDYQSVWMDLPLVAVYEAHGWNKVVVGWKSREDGGHLTLARTDYKGQLIPGTLHAKACHFTYAGEEKLHDEYQVYLVAPAAANHPPKQALEEASENAVELTIVLGELKGDDVNIRKLPVTGTPLFALSTGDQVAILQEVLPEGETIPWYLINYEDKQGWIRSDFVQRLN
jgi:hypothetical protein